MRTLIAAVVVCWTGIAAAQPTPEPETRFQSAARLLEALRAAGVELPEGARINADGSVTLPGNLAPDEAGPSPAEGQRLQPPGPGEDAVDLAPAEEPKKDRWKNFAELSLNFSDGNSETVDFRAAVESVRETDRSKLRINAQYLYSTDDGSESKDQGRVLVLHDWLFPEERYLFFAEGRYDYDEFESFLHRTTVSGGVGYKLVDTEKMTFIGRGGFAATREFDSPRDEVIAEALLGFDWTWDINDSQSLEVTNRSFWDLNEGDEFRVLTDAAWRLNLDEVFEGLTLSAGIQHEYRTAVSSPTERSDVNAFISLGVRF